MATGKRILMLTHEFPPYPGGVGRYCWSLAAAAARAGHRVKVLAPVHATHRSDHYRDPPGVEVVHFGGDLFHFRELPALEQLVEDTLATDHWDLVHAADWPMIAAFRRIEIDAAERVASLHGSDVLLFRHSLRARIARVQRALRRFQPLVCNSAYTASLLRSRFPDVPDIRVAPLGVDARWFEEPTTEAVAAYRSRVGCTEEDRIVLTVARLDERKGHLATLAAIAKLPERERRNLVYVCVGRSVDSVYEARIAEAAQRLGVRTVLAGTLPDAELLAAYRTAEVLALCGQEVPQKVEGFGLVLLEAAAQGLPAVVTNVHALPEVVVNGTTGWVCEGNDPARLAVVLSMALASSGGQELREACIAHARQFTWDRCAALTYGQKLAAVA
ncbi:MAG TPA: glycosyltransferase family 4 protein [Steroidobacteraceae bacterium]|jgi:phosphatidylinositol alpha-1,6-mannosyltransferase|nr:glycosyltransferase family 4 protein [Steroidobacteraceae bacterium]